MSKGVTVSCEEPSCRKIVIRYANVKGEGSFETFCPHCGKLTKIEITQKTVIKAKLVIPLAIFTLLFIYGVLKIQKLENIVTTLSTSTYFEK